MLRAAPRARSPYEKSQRALWSECGVVHGRYTNGKATT
jgi:hypothetical protein